MRDTSLRLSKGMRFALGDLKQTPRETYEDMLRKKLFNTKKRKQILKNRMKMFPQLNQSKATRAVFNSDNKTTKEVVGY